MVSDDEQRPPADGGDQPSIAARLALVEAALNTRWPESRIDPSLERISDLLDLLGAPQRSYPVIHVAGTNGKTSVARMIESLLTSFGLSVGRYTSPHLTSVVERISVAGEPVDPERFVEGFVDLAPYLDLVDSRHDNPLSYFEVLTALAFSLFADAPVDIAVVEVGLGGTWDSTNLVVPAVAVITPVGLDHQDYLGDTIEEIAAEKAGIIKAESLVVMAQQELEPARVLLARVAEVGATVAREGLEFGVASRELAVGGQLLAIQGLGGTYDEIFLPLHGAHQAHNAAVALAAVEGFLGGGQGLLDLDAVRTGFAAATSPGRLEVIRRSPAVLLDAAHNLDGARVLAATIEDAFTFSRVVGLVGVLQGKDAAGFLATLEPVLTDLVITQSSSPRAIPADELGSLAAEIFGDDRVEVVPVLLDAYDRALELAETDAHGGGGAVLVTGSVVTVGEIRALVQGPGPVR